MPKFCPHCGYNFAPDAEIVDGDWLLGPGVTFYKGARLPVTYQQAAMLHTIASAKGRPVSRAVISARIGSTGDPNLASVQACLMRAKLPTVPFETVQGAGYRWAA